MHKSRCCGGTTPIKNSARSLRESRQEIDRGSDDLQRTAEAWIHVRRLTLERASGVLGTRSPERRIAEALHLLSRSRGMMDQFCARALQNIRSELGKNAAVLGALNPSAALARGYTLTLGKDGKLIRSAAAVAEGDLLVTKFPDGSVRSIAQKMKADSAPADAT